MSSMAANQRSIKVIPLIIDDRPAAFGEVKQ